jgi:hypothetical protein
MQRKKDAACTTTLSGWNARHNTFHTFSFLRVLFFFFFFLPVRIGLVYCIEYLEKNLIWLKNHIKEVQKSTPSAYFLFDLPGQVELYSHHDSLKRIVDKMTQSWGLRLTCVHLVDSHHVSDPAKYISVLLLSLASMTQLSLPHVNVLSKMDLIESMGRLEFGLEFYTDVLDLSYLLPRLRQQAGAAHPLAKKFSRLTKSLAELIESYNLVSFVPLDIQNPQLIANVVRIVDKANGYMYLPSESGETGRGAAGATTNSNLAAQRNLLTMVDKTHMQELDLSVHPLRTTA